MNAPVKSDNPNVIGIKHMAFAVKDAKKALESYSRFLCVPADTKITEYEKSRNRVALFNLGGIEYQLCQSMDADGFRQRRRICTCAALRHALARGSTHCRWNRRRSRYGEDLRRRAP